ncbi:BamA/TamA family outer membrane protein [Bacteroides graminisolvens]|uniref:translocation and assembly module lipoprotein TamL n=1 Tax=Bacteroides graminisolvens TaxID=477666 RepID=UPI0029C62ADC|nr:BamA/TamA family outer membrane protein [Bacteroides graminisolvens]
MNKGFRYIIYSLFAMTMVACSGTKYVPEGAYLLDKVAVQADNNDTKSTDLSTYIRQKPNNRWFSVIKTQLYIYNLSGRDSTKWYNRMLRRIGDAPVVYSEYDTQRSQEELKKAVQNMGYMGAEVYTDKKIKKKKIEVTYRVASGKPYIVRSVKLDVKDKKIAEYLQNDSANSLLRPGMLLNVNKLDNERQRITSFLQQNGYYRFNKDFISYSADTVRSTYLVDLTLHLLQFKAYTDNEPSDHKQYKIGKVSFITDYDVLQSSALSSIEINDSIHYKNYPIYYKDNLYLRPKVLVDNLQIRPGELYNERNVQRTYNNFGRLSALKYTNVRFFDTQVADTNLLNCYVLLTKGRHQSVAFEVEGTNSAGDLGAAASVSFQHRNLFHGSETFMVKLRGAYEAISGLQQGYSNDNYTEYGVESSINFPSFLFPFLATDFKNRIRATTEFGLQYNSQQRPEFSRKVASASWSYKWSNSRKSQHRFDLLDVSFLYFPWVSDTFKQKYEENNQSYIFEYNYKDRLIVRMGYMFNYNSAGERMANNTIKSNSFSIRAGLESAGNVMYAISNLTKLSKNSDGEYSLLNIPYAQYVKGDFDFSRNIVIDDKNAIAYHVGVGIAVPYGNSKSIPYIKQYFSGGANSVRGWSVRELGPGSFPGDGNYLNQSGDIKFDASIEYRSKLFWLLQGALFVDAGNIWTIKEYENQPGGQFDISKFYKQIAFAYGLGIRIDLDYLVFRIDGGMKALNPAYSSGKQRYPILNPNFKRDFTFHLAVGYPF